ncbi:hypothetical protein RHOSPDRAFT_36101 [Rhodotorula sp. JG-1b]|nr:hypothetical protein RHOSPDRAFT_36101 [Rhodotorula sp. JG-1b]
MSDPQDRLLAEYCPPLDSALVYAILSDYDSPLSHQDEHTARELLSSLAQVAAADQDNDLDNDLSPSDDPSSAQTTSLEADSASLAPVRVPVQDERVELLRLLDQAAAELAPRTEQQQQLRRPLTAAPGPRSGNTVVSELTGALETTSLGGGSSSSTSAAVAPSRFSNTSTASSSVTTASENDDDDDQLQYASDSHKTMVPAALVWDSTAAAVAQHDDLDDDDFGTFYDVQDDPLAFLASVFPHIELALLEAKIKEASSAASPTTTTTTQPGDLEALIEDLLSQDLITSLTEADAEAAAAANAPAPDPDRFADLSKQQKRRVKAAHKAANSYSLTSTRQQPQPVSYASAARGAEDGTAASALAAAPSGANAWVSFSSQASLLATLLHIPPTRVTSTYYQQSSSLPQTISVLLTQLATERDFSTQIPNALELRAQLRLIVPPNRASDDDLEVLLSATEGDLSDALDLHHFVREVEASMGTNLTLSSLVARDSSTDAAAAAGGGGGEKGGFMLVPSAAAARRRATTAIDSNHLLASASASTTATDRYSYEDCASFALEYLVKRNEAFRTAARSFQRGGRGERGAAGYWAEKGREYDRERRKWEERAARATVGERRHKTQDPYTIDLHGLTLAHALTIVDETCNSWWSANRDAEHVTPLRIITGVGRHSRNNAPVLAPAVTKHLDRHGWYWKWDDSPLTLASGGLSGTTTPGGGGGGGGGGGVRGAVKVLGVK